MNLKMLAAAIAFAGIATPAFAQFWIVRDGPIGRCVIVDKEPAVGTIVIAGGQARFYSTRAEAETDAQAMCRLRRA
jgi:hypothetical protein